MAKGFIRKFKKVPRWTLHKWVSFVASFPSISDAACPTFPAVPTAFLKSQGYFSQIGQDYLVDQLLLNSVTHGVFVDVGAHDGMEFNNTYFFESARGWTGLCIEPNPDVYEALASNRTCATEQVAVGASEGKVKFTAIKGPADMLSGISKNYNRRHKSLINAGIKAANGSHRVLEVPLRPLQALLDTHGITRIDFLSIDTEGSELDVLKGIDFKKTRVSCIAIERNYESGSIPQLLKSQGFIRVMALAWDDIYIRADLLLVIPGGSVPRDLAQEAPES